MIRTGSRPVFDDAFLLKLDKRGIRSIERVGGRYLIVAGPFDSDKDGKLGFALYSWSGRRGEDPTPIDADLGKLHPEALFAVQGDKEIDILSDDGDERVDGKKCKNQRDLAKKSFRARIFKVP